MPWHLFRDREHDESYPLDGVGPAPDAAFWSSPLGQATQAMERGDRFFQIELDDATLASYPETAVVPHGRRARRTRDLLGQIEELGWHLEHVSWWRVDRHDQVPPDSVATDSGSEHVRGVYLFHSLASSEPGWSAPPEPPEPETHAPTHRLDVVSGS